jgi:hypothetical protein
MTVVKPNSARRTAGDRRSCCRKTRRGRAGALVTRPSCLECVEKHLGAAWVLLAEHRDGYATRLRAIGHLFEAEDESQAWPDLHDAIREARRAYQQAGKVPGFTRLALVLARYRQERSLKRSS